MSINSKLVQKQLRSLIPSLSEKELRRIFESFKETIGDSIQYNCKEISYKCYEGTLCLKGKRASGYGRNDQEAYCHAIKNLLEMLIQEDQLLFVLRHCIKKVNEGAQNQEKENQPRKSLAIKPNMSLASNLSILENEQRKSKVHLKSSLVDSINISINKPNNKSQVELELEGAKIYIIQLEQKLKNLEEENKFLKNKTQSQAPQFASGFTSTTVKPIVNNFVICQQEAQVPNFNHRMSFDPKHTLSHFSHNEKIVQKLNCSVEDVTKKLENERKVSKVPVPKLKLEILPSFHGKSNKSINHSFLAHQQAVDK